jgi:hypothetical protein
LFVLKNDSFLDLWFGLPGTLEALDRLAREFFDASSTNDETHQKSLIEKAREQVKGFVDKKDQKRLKYLYKSFHLFLYIILVGNPI